MNKNLKNNLKDMVPFEELKGFIRIAIIVIAFLALSALFKWLGAF
jgi:hypothetical protein